MLGLFFSYYRRSTWVMHRERLRFLEVNDAAVSQDVYSMNEFTTMSILDLRPEEERARYRDQVQQIPNEGLHHGHCKHRNKDGKSIEAESISHELASAGRRVPLVPAQAIS